MFARQAFRCSQSLKQGFRKYSTEAPKAKASLAPIYVGVGLAGLGVGLYRYNSASSATAEAPVVREKVFKGGDQGWFDLKLSEIEVLNHNTKRLRFEFEDKEAISGLQVASALLTKFKPVDAKAVIRPYTPTSDEETPGYIDLVVKVYPDGAMSNYLHNMNVGQRLDFKGPIVKYPWETNKHKHITLIAGGTGITPMYQLAREIFKNPEDQTKVTLVFGNVTEQDILLKKEFEELENTYPRRFRAFYILDQPPKEWTGGKGFISKELLKTVLPEPKEENIKIFVCGPPGLYKAISGPKKSPADQGELSGVLAELGYSKDQVFKF
ncbi:NADH-cytochrome b5 reductase [Aspergillus japonicus CBS 114.51]|uniref:NADH-cytochrome b5 reductase n=1 Tax=Aspergillus japonicus CBS 114.51 TaxID=1448312 RepID=A0A8T8WUS9_ASPJA|nr:NADH-cytochrome b5 reductase [Aspergillus japonicus CBS 114.51]RAH79581.1 NADH-cytochrome b5 reductase [Aspergillus japonicus CBS 114.51]